MGPADLRDRPRRWGIAALAATGAWGTYHLTNDGSCTWAEWAVVEIFLARRAAGGGEPIPAATFKRDATPPTNGAMANVAAAALGVALPDWRDGLRRCLGEMGEVRGGRWYRRLPSAVETASPGLRVAETRLRGLGFCALPGCFAK
ncbi:MAG: sugar nucleotide-binding protein [Chloroflexia bacterium]